MVREIYGDIQMSIELHPRSPRHSVASPVVPSSAASPTGVLTAPFGASKLPAIGKVPDIKINTSHRPRRDPNDETRAAPAPGSLTEPREAIQQTFCNLGTKPGAKLGQVLGQLLKY